MSKSKTKICKEIIVTLSRQLMLVAFPKNYPFEAE